MNIINDYGVLADALVHYSRLCYQRRLVGAAGGNLSVRLPGRDAFLVTASGVSLRDVARENLVVIDGSGKVLEGPSGSKPSKETGFHLAVYEAKPAVCAIIHIHPPYATAYSARRQPIPAVDDFRPAQAQTGPCRSAGAARFQRTARSCYRGRQGIAAGGQRAAIGGPRPDGHAAHSVRRLRRRGVGGRYRENRPAGESCRACESVFLPPCKWWI